MNPITTDCIAAIATPPGQGAIAVIRMSGGNALEIAHKVFRGRAPLTEVPGYSVQYGMIVNSRGEILDAGLATVFREPHSYTGENSVELSCHGGSVIVRSVLEALIDGGARQAEPGEFTKRAFLNGKMDLSQAEAVADLVGAGSRRAQRASIRQLEGKLGSAVNELREQLIDLCALLELDLDFSEEGIEVITGNQVVERIAGVENRLSMLVDSFSVGRVYREGVGVVLAGKPNVGKSSLFNALLQEERAIVAAHPGTTRDTIEESLEIAGVLFRVTDTAGLREAETVVEAEGVKRARSTVGDADIILLVIDAGDEPDPIAARQIADGLSQGQRIVVAYNKADLVADAPRRSKLTAEYGLTGTFTSATDGEGIHELKDLLAKVILVGEVDNEGDLYVTNERHYRALVKARQNLSQAKESCLALKANEFVAFDVREAAQALSEITGEITTDEVLNSIFSKFCIGK